MSSVQSRSLKVRFTWNRERQASRNWDDDGPKEVRCSFTCESEKILNVDAYQPGDFRIFFADPRTRADYLKWAPLLLEAEEYHAGSRVVDPIAPAPRPKPPSREGRRRYAIQKRRKSLIGKAVRLTRDVTMRNGTVYKKGSLWRVHSGKAQTISVCGITEEGTREPCVDGERRRAIVDLSFDDVAVDASVPDAPKRKVRDDGE